jgi:hypothetical protein
MISLLIEALYVSFVRAINYTLKPATHNRRRSRSVSFVFRKAAFVPPEVGIERMSQRYIMGRRRFRYE